MRLNTGGGNIWGKVAQFIRRGWEDRETENRNRKSIGRNWRKRSTRKRQNLWQKKIRTKTARISTEEMNNNPLPLSFMSTRNGELNTSCSILLCHAALLRHLTNSCLINKLRVSCPEIEKSIFRYSYFAILEHDGPTLFRNVRQQLPHPRKTVTSSVPLRKPTNSIYCTFAVGVKRRNLRDSPRLYTAKDRRVIHGFEGMTWGKKPLGRPRCRWDYIIKMDFKKWY